MNWFRARIAEIREAEQLADRLVGKREDARYWTIGSVLSLSAGAGAATLFLIAAAPAVLPAVALTGGVTAIFGLVSGSGLAITNTLWQRRRLLHLRKGFRSDASDDPASAVLALREDARERIRFIEATVRSPRERAERTARVHNDLERQETAIRKEAARERRLERLNLQREAADGAEYFARTLSRAVAIENGRVDVASLETLDPADLQELEFRPKGVALGSTTPLLTSGDDSTDWAQWRSAQRVESPDGEPRWRLCSPDGRHHMDLPLSDLEARRARVTSKP